MEAEEITRMFLALGVLLGTARMLGEWVQRFHQPAVLGEIAAGVLLGPTVLGALAPEANAWLFPPVGPNAIALSALATLSIALFLLVAGMEVDLSTVWRQGRTALCVSGCGVSIPFGIGFLSGWFAPETFGRDPSGDRFLFALFLGTAMGIAALPVIAKTLMDLGLYRSDFGMVVISAAIVDDLTGWMIFAVILGLMGGHAGEAGGSVAATIAMTLGFAALMLTLGRAIVHRLLPYLQAYTHWPGGELSFALVLALFGAAATEWIGIHAIFGAFLVGVIVGDSDRLRERTRTIIDQFVSFFFAPLFFATVGLQVNFVTHFDGPLVIAVLTIACVGKLIGASIGARLGGLPSRDALAVGFAMNARGAMEIILGLLALRAGIIGERLFVALVIMALVTSMAGGPAIRGILRLKKPRRLASALSPRLFVRELRATGRREAIAELARAAAVALPLDAGDVEDSAWRRECLLPTGIGHGIALPHARLDRFAGPVVVVGLSEAGIDFDAPDGEPAHVLFLILTASEDTGAQLELSAEIGHLFSQPDMLERTLRTRSFAEFLSLVKSTNRGGTDHGSRLG